MPALAGELSAGNYTVTVGGNPVTLNGTPVEVPLDFDIEVTAEGREFKGILIRVGGTTTDQVTTSSDLVAPARACEDVGSVTHGNAFAKTVGIATVSFDAATTLDVDISIVVENADDASTFYYSSFQLSAVGDDSTGGDTTTNETPEGEAPTSDAIALGGAATSNHASWCFRSPPLKLATLNIARLLDLNTIIDLLGMKRMEFIQRFII